MAISALMRGNTLPGVDSESRSATAVARMDEESFRAFYERTARLVWAYLARLTGDGQAADDLLQEAYYRFYRAGTMYESEKHRRNSLFRIATNLARDRGRRLRRGADVPMEETLQAVDRTADSAVERADLGRALARLRPLQREILWLAYAQGSSHDEIAGVVGVSRKSIKSLLFRARRKLAELLRSEGAHRD